MSDRQPNKEDVRIKSLEHSPRSRQTSDGDLHVGEYLASRTRLQKQLATTEARDLRPDRLPAHS